MSDLAIQEKNELEVESFTQELSLERTSSIRVSTGRKRNILEISENDVYRDRPSYTGIAPQQPSANPTEAGQNTLPVKAEEPITDGVPFVVLGSNFVVRQKWEGVVLEVNAESFSVRLFDLSSDERDEEAELDLSEVSREDLKLVEPGAVFYWSIGYYTTGDGQVQRTSQIRFRRLPAWSKSELERAEVRAKELLEALGDIHT